MRSFHRFAVEVLSHFVAETQSASQYAKVQLFASCSDHNLPNSSHHMTARRTISPELERTAGASARRSSLRFDEGSQLIESSPSQEVNEIAHSSLEIGPLCGKGGFSNVNEVTIRDDSNNGKTNGRKYAIKYLRDSVMKKRASLKVGAADLAIEARILSHISHPNIVKLHGISAGSLSNAYKHNHRFFLVLDLLSCSLEDKLAAWGFEEEQEVAKQSRLLPRFGLSDPQKIRLYERMNSVAIPVANALKYLHEKNIVLRDLKPGNIGFDKEGTVKLFDFGMAREVKDGRKLTGGTGSPIYMSPEVMLCKSYGLPADIYSMAYVLWELATLKLPFDGITRDDHAKTILVDNGRPKVDNRCGSTRMQKLITECWERSPKSRPTALEVLATLNVEVNRKLGGAYRETKVTEERTDLKAPRLFPARARAA